MLGLPKPKKKYKEAQDLRQFASLKIDHQRLRSLFKCGAMRRCKFLPVFIALFSPRRILDQQTMVSNADHLEAPITVEIFK